MSGLPGGVVTFLFTDVEGSTWLLDEIGKERYASVQAEHRTALREVFERHGGMEVDTQGDAFFVGFPTASGAIAAAAEVQERLAEGPVRVRMGIHTGEPLRTDEGYVGMAVHRAARIAAVAHGGQVVVSDATRQVLDDDSGLRDLGLHRLKDLSAPQRLFQVGDEAFPPLRSLQGTNLPVPPTPFLGREREVAAVVELLRRPEVRLVTLTGPGGTGKTRLALQAAADLADEAEDGVTWVSLGSVADASLVPAEIAAARGARLTGDGDPVRAVGALLAGRHVLLVLDNLEHLIEVARDVATLVAACPDLRILATSREPLAVAAEHQYFVPSMSRPEAVALFEQRALAVEPDFVAGEAVAQLCARLDDLPLAIELAAARVRALSPEALVERLGQRLDLLKGGRDADPRQQTLRATIAWSHDLLDELERRVFASLAVFHGGCRLEDAEAVSDADVDHLSALVDKSLVRVRRNGGAERYWMLETVRVFALERLEALADAAALRDRHAYRYLEIAERSFASVQAVGRSAEEYERLAAEEGNLRLALRTLRDGPDVDAFGRLCAALFFYWFFRGFTSEGVEWTRSALARDVSEGLRAELENELAALLYLSGSASTESLSLAESSVRRARTLGDDKRLMMGLTTVGNLHNLIDETGDLELALAMYEEALEIARHRREEWWERALLSNIGALHGQAERIELALEYLQEALELSLAVGDQTNAAIVELHIAGLRAAQRDWGRARAALAESLPTVARLDLTPWLIEALLVAAEIANGESFPKRAVRLVGHALATREERTIGSWKDERALETTLREQLGGEDYAALLREGEALSRDEAVALALEET